MNRVSTSQSPMVRTKRMDSFVLLLLAASLALNVYLGWKLRQGSPNTRQNTVTLSPGMKIDPVTVVTLDGIQHTISYENTNKPTVLYVLSPACIWCDRNNANFKRLSELRAKDFRFIGLSLAEPGLKAYVDAHHLKFPVYTRLTTESINALGLGSTPQTIVISPDGRVLKNWIGAYLDPLRPEVEAYFGITLPGLTSDND
ncbi:MAG TPA: TlpA disulfide reductase family protein [Pyrinomonadaceae bacterium]|nr:TlpA disulfide reductase family protein [Pyrinomonadaceae bacterium]